jgi:hypothetical protein
VRLVDNEKDHITQCGEEPAYFQLLVDFLNGKSVRPMDVVFETHPTRVVIAAKQSALSGGEFVSV